MDSRTGKTAPLMPAALAEATKERVRELTATAARANPLGPASGFLAGPDIRVRSIAPFTFLVSAETTSHNVRAGLAGVGWRV